MITMTDTITPTLDYKVADITLAEFGRKEITIAEHEMPGLMATREKYGPSKPLAGVKIMGSLHMTIQTAVLIETLVDLGAERPLVFLQHLFHPRPCRAAIAAAGVPVFAWKGETLEDYWDCTWNALTWPDGSGPDQIVDDGGDATLLIHKGVELENGSDWVNGDSDNHEEQVIKDLLKKVHADNPHHWTPISRKSSAYPKKPPPVFTVSLRWKSKATFFFKPSTSMIRSPSLNSTTTMAVVIHSWTESKERWTC